MTNPTKTASLTHRIASIFNDWLATYRSMLETDQLEPTEFERIAHDLGTNPHALKEMILSGPHGADELPHMLAALGISEGAVARINPMVLHDMERVCASCGEKGQCHRSLAAGSASSDYAGFCANASTIEALRATPA